MRDPIEIRHNRTGIEAAGERAREMIADAAMFLPEPSFEGLPLDTERVTFILESEPAGTMPPPGGLKEAMKSALQTIQGKNAAVLLDALGARLAFERTGVRLYEALLTKARALGAEDGGPTEAELSEIWNDELGHFQLLHDAVAEMGGDPTAVTPCANLEAVLSIGPLQVASDPRLHMRESLHAALIIELSDNESWELLIRTAESLGQTEMARSFESCLATEAQHLTRVRGWVKAMTEHVAGRRVDTDDETTTDGEGELPASV